MKSSLFDWRKTRSPNVSLSPIRGVFRLLTATKGWRRPNGSAPVWLGALAAIALTLGGGYDQKAMACGACFGLPDSDGLAEKLGIDPDDLDDTSVRNLFETPLPGIGVFGEVEYQINGTFVTRPYVAVVDIFGRTESARFVGGPQESGSAAAVSQNPHAVGFLDSGFFTPFHAFSFDLDTEALVDLGTLNPGNANAQSFGRGVNADGSVAVGFSEIAGAGGLHGFRWTQAGGMKDLDVSAPTVTSRAYAANGDGNVIVGQRAGQAVRWNWNPTTQTATFTNLTLGLATAITEDASVIVGFINGTDNAFRWTQASGVVDLGTLPGRTDSVALDVSEDGKIVVGASQNGPIDFAGVGGSVRLIPTAARAFIWTDPTQGGNGMEDLNQVMTDAGVNLNGITLVALTGISPDGLWFSGQATTPQTSGTETVPFIAMANRYGVFHAVGHPGGGAPGPDTLPPGGSPSAARSASGEANTAIRNHRTGGWRFVAGDLDGNGVSDTIFHYGEEGLWARLNGTKWTRLTTLSPDRMEAIDLDANGKDDVVAEFKRIGVLVRYNDNPIWLKPRPSHAAQLAERGFE